MLKHNFRANVSTSQRVNNISALNFTIDFWDRLFQDDSKIIQLRHNLIFNSLWNGRHTFIYFKWFVRPSFPPPWLSQNDNASQQSFLGGEFFLCHAFSKKSAQNLATAPTVLLLKPIFGYNSMTRITNTILYPLISLTRNTKIKWTSNPNPNYPLATLTVAYHGIITLFSTWRLCSRDAKRKQETGTNWLAKPAKIGWRKNSPRTNRNRSYILVCSPEQIRQVENRLNWGFAVKTHQKWNK